MPTVRKPAKATPPPRNNKPESESEGSAYPALRPTEMEGVFLNRFGVKVGADGVALSFAALKAKDTQRQAQALAPKNDTGTTLDFVESVRADPGLPLDMRLRAANMALPYQHQKKPTAFVGGGGPDSPIQMHVTMDVMLQQLAEALPRDEAMMVMEVLRRANERKMAAASPPAAEAVVPTEVKATKRGKGK